MNFMAMNNQYYYKAQRTVVKPQDLELACRQILLASVLQTLQPLSTIFYVLLDLPQAPLMSLMLKPQLWSTLFLQLHGDLPHFHAVIQRQLPLNKE
jgi:hypothetical protein